MHRIQFAVRITSRVLAQRTNLPSHALRSVNEFTGCAALSVREFHSSQARYGITDTLKNAYGAAFSGAEEKREQKVFEVQMKMLRDGSRLMDGDGYLELLSEMKSATGMGGVKEHLPWVQNNPALQDFKDREAILCAMTPAERRDPGIVRIASKKRIANTSGYSMDQIESVIEQVQSMSSIQQWVIMRERQGLPLPTDSKQLRNMIFAPGSGMKQRKSGRSQFPNPGIGKKFKRRTR